MKKKLLFITGTRADFGKLSSLIDAVSLYDEFEYSIFVTGMHTLTRYGYTVDEVMKKYPPLRLNRGFRNVHVFMNQVHGESMDMVLGNTIFGLSRYVSEYNPDMIIVHGDRVEALAGATVGSLRNIFVAHIEGGEVSGTVDELIRHAITKLAHLHFVANEESARRLIQMGEKKESIFNIGSPDIDLMLSPNLPSLEEVLQYYTIPFKSFAIALLHPITTNIPQTKDMAKNMLEAMLESNENYVVIYPNNDHGNNFIFEEYEKLNGNNRFKQYPSIRINYFLTLLRNAKYLLGNSSAGIRETPVYGVPSINIGDRQLGRYSCPSILNVTAKKQEILSAIETAKNMEPHSPTFDFGNGNSAEHFLDVLKDQKVWATSNQKQFVDY